MKNLIIKTAISVSVVMAGVFLLGLFLNEANKGTYGDLVKGFAKNVTNGYGAPA